jgi:hypothetical protein
MKRTTKYPKCPNCGNKNRTLIEDNGGRGDDLTYLCVARVPPGEDAFGGDASPPLEVGTDGLVTCAMQWDAEER